MHYTRLIFLCLVFLGFSETGFAQIAARKPVLSLGLKGVAGIAGIANQNNYGQNEMDYRLTPGFGGGITFGYHLNPRSALLLEVFYQSAGQKYEDHFKGRTFAKEVSYNLLCVPVLYRYLLSEPEGGYTGVGTEFKPQWYVAGGIQYDQILSPEITWNLDGAATGFEAFVLEGGNPNETAITMMGTPASDAEFFTSWHIEFIAAAGFEIPASARVSYTLELHGGIGLTDLNAEEWRLDNHRGVYGASRNSFLGLHGAVRFRLSGE